MPPIFSPETLLTVVMKSTYIIGIASAKYIFIFQKITVIIDTVFYLCARICMLEA